MQSTGHGHAREVHHVDTGFGDDVRHGRKLSWKFSGRGARAPAHRWNDTTEHARVGARPGTIHPGRTAPPRGPGQPPGEVEGSAGGVPSGTPPVPTNRTGTTIPFCQ